MQFQKSRPLLILILLVSVGGLWAGDQTPEDAFKAFRQRGDAQRYLAKAFQEFGSGSREDAKADFLNAQSKDEQSFGVRLGEALTELDEGWDNKLKKMAEDPDVKGSLAAPVMALLLKGKQANPEPVFQLASLAARRCDDAQRLAESGDYEGSLRALKRHLSGP
jgi:hypothetical protein